MHLNDPRAERQLRHVRVPRESDCGTRRGEALLRRVQFVHGVPKHFRSDSAQEFVGNVITILGEKLGVEHQQTHGYHPEGNSRVERVHRYLGRCIKRT